MHDASRNINQLAFCKPALEPGKRGKRI